jgi:predicted transcriptional regulator
MAAGKQPATTQGTARYLDLTLAVARQARAFSQALIKADAGSLGARLCEVEILGQLKNAKSPLPIKRLAKGLRLSLKVVNRSMEALRAEDAVSVTAAGGQAVAALTSKGEKRLGQLSEALEQEVAQRAKSAHVSDRTLNSAADGLKLVGRAVIDRNTKKAKKAAK